MRPPCGILDPSLARGRDGSGYWRWSRECRNPGGPSAGFAILARGCFARSREIVAGLKWRFPADKSSPNARRDRRVRQSRGDGRQVEGPVDARFRRLELGAELDPEYVGVAAGLAQKL